PPMPSADAAEVRHTFSLPCRWPGVRCRPPGGVKVLDRAVCRATTASAASLARPCATAGTVVSPLQRRSYGSQCAIDSVADLRICPSRMMRTGFGTHRLIGAACALSSLDCERCGAYDREPFS